MHFLLRRTFSFPAKRLLSLPGLSSCSVFRTMVQSTKTSSDYLSCLYEPLKKQDPEIADLIAKEMARQTYGLELIASENYTSQAVIDALGSILTNKYSEGLPGARYYGGNQYIDCIENICRERALKAFHLDSSTWGVNVQPYSGSPANFAAYTAVLQPHDRLMGLDLPSGGHLTHGYYTEKRKVSATSIYFESFPYRVNPKTGLLDYDGLAESAKVFKPKLIICGASAYPRDWDYARLRAIADESGAYLLADMAHISGLIAAQEANNPFLYCDLVTTTTHKTLRGPRSGIIFFRKTNRSDNCANDLESRVNNAVFPCLQGGPHNNVIAGVAVALKQAADPEFRTYICHVKENCVVLSETLKSFGYKIVTDGTDNHLLLLDLRPLGLTGSKAEKFFEAVHISVNKNTIHGDKSAVTPGGIRIGTAALSSRGLQSEDMRQVAGLIHEALQLALVIQSSCCSKLLKDFVSAFESNPEVKALAEKVKKFAGQFPVPGQC